MTVRTAPGYAPTPAAPPPPVAGTRRVLDADLLPTVALGALTVVSVLAFSRVFTTPGWIAPAVLTAVAAHVLAWWLRARHVPVSIAVAVELVVVAAVAAYLILPGDLTWGLPLGHLYHGLGTSLRHAGTGMRVDITPVPSAPGYSLLVAWGAGVAAVVADLLAFHLRAALQALAPPFALFLTASAIGTAQGRAWTVGAEVGAIAVFLLAEQIAAQHGATWLGGRAAGTARVAATAGALSAAVAVIAAVALTPVIPAREGDGILGWRSATGGGNGTRITPSPFDDLRTRLLDNPDTVVMTVESSQPSYWRLTSLDNFDGTVWSSNDSYQSINGRLPGVSLSPGTQQVSEQFQIAALDSIWLPTGFDPEVVHRVANVSWDPTSGSLISSKATSNGESYSVDASEQLAELSPRLLSAAPPLSSASVPTSDVSLPGDIPSAVLALGHKITAGDQTEYAKAYALEQFFHRSPFEYTTTPISDDSSSALDTFLFSTHQGYCQQFAGAYAVLARAVGLPTRIAVGFQTGALNGGVYTVTDADAHAWPEVWFPTVGWVPFEPTPGRQVPGATYTGNTSAVQSSPSSAITTTTAPAAAKSGSSSAPKVHLPTGASASTAAPVHHTNSPFWAVVGLVVSLMALVVVLWGSAVATMRRLRWRRRRSRAAHPPHGDALFPAPGPRPDGFDTDPTARQRVLVAWAETAELLAWWRLRRRPDETVMEFAERAALELPRPSTTIDASADELLELAGLVQRAEFSAVDVTRTNADQADRLARSVIDQLRRAIPRGRRFELLIDPRQALRPTVVENSS